MTDAEQKKRAILNKFRRESSKFDLRLKLRLASIWIDILVKGEEYEMAEALRQEREVISNTILKQKRKSRTFYQRIRYYIIKIKRFIR